MEAKQIRQDVAEAIGRKERELLTVSREGLLPLARWVCVWIIHVQMGVKSQDAIDMLQFKYHRTMCNHAMEKIKFYMKHNDDQLRRLLKNLYKINPEYRQYFGETLPKYKGEECHTSPTNLKLKNAVAC